MENFKSSCLAHKYLNRLENDLAYFAEALRTEKTGLIVLSPVANVIKLFIVVSYDFS